jgi:hypothetical protein
MFSEASAGVLKQIFDNWSERASTSGGLLSAGFITSLGRASCQRLDAEGRTMPPLTQADATNLLIQWLRDPDHGGASSYGYGIYLPALVRGYLRKKGIRELDQEHHLEKMMPMLYAAAWDLCRRGIIRPGVRAHNAQATADGASVARMELSAIRELLVADPPPDKKNVPLGGDDTGRGIR